MKLGANRFLIGWCYGLHPDESANQLSHFDIERSWIRCFAEQSHDNCTLITPAGLDLGAVVLTVWFYKARDYASDIHGGYS